MSEYTERVARALDGLDGVSTGVCPGCITCSKDYGFHDDLAAFEAAYDAGEVVGETYFSWRACSVCGSHLGGDREPLHYVLDGEIHHDSGACVDCIVYLANGDEPINA